MKLNARMVETASEGTFNDGRGLQLVVGSNGSRRWNFRFQMNGKRRDMGLGTYPEISLAGARAAAEDERRLVARGVDPIDERRKQRVETKAEQVRQKTLPTFADVARDVIGMAAQNSKSPKAREAWERLLGPVYCGTLLNIPCHEIATTDVVNVLRPVWFAKPETARKMLPAIRSVLTTAQMRLRKFNIEMRDNAADWKFVKAEFKKAPTQLSKGPHASLSYSQMPEFMAALREREAVAALMLEFLVLTNARTGSVLSARWCDIDEGAAVWSIPVEFLKDGEKRSKPFRIPLSKRALEIVETMRPMRTGPLLFPTNRVGKPMSVNAMLKLLERINPKLDTGGFRFVDPDSERPITPHGFRATFRTWAEEQTNATNAAVEDAMGHVVGSKVERRYRRTDLLEPRKVLMQLWADWCDGGRETNVVPLVKRKA
jgi:integrase